MPHISYMILRHIDVHDPAEHAHLQVQQADIQMIDISDDEEWLRVDASQVY